MKGILTQKYFDFEFDKYYDYTNRKIFPSPLLTRQMSLLSETALPLDSETFTADELNEGQETSKKTGIFTYAWMPLK